MKKDTKKTDIIIIIILILIAAAAILIFALPHQADANDRQSSKASSYTDYNGRIIGVGTGSMFDEMVTAKLPDSELMYFNTYADMLTAVSVGKIDAACLDEPIIRYIMNEFSGVTYLNEPLDSYSYGFGFAKNDSGKALCDKLSEYIRKIRNDWTLEEIDRKWFSSDKSLHTVPELSSLDSSNGVLKLAVEPGNAPFTYLYNNAVVGYEIDIAYRFCKEYGYGLDIRITDFDAIIPSIQTGLCDFGCSCMTITPERSESLYFSEPDYTGGAVLAVRRSDIDDSPAVEDRPFSYYAENKKIGVITGGLYEIMIKERYPDSDLYQYNNQADLGAALHAGLIDCFTVPRSTAEDFKKQYSGLTYLNEVFTKIPYGFAFERSADKEYLRDQMNDFLKKMRNDGTYDEIVSVWFGDDESKKVVDSSGLTGSGGELKMVTTATMQPFSYIKDGKNVGLEIDIVTRFCREYGYSLTIDSAEFASLIPGITSGKYDIASGNIMITAERAESVNFSDVYYTADAVAVVRDESKPAETAPDFFESIAESFEKNFIREERWKLILEGIGTTCIITLLSALSGTLLAFLICMFRRTGSRLANAISDIYVRLMQGTPVVVLLMILYYVIFGKSGIESIWVAVIGFSLNFGAYVSEIMRSGIESIDAGQREAALALGYSETQTFFRFIFPQAAVRFIPVYRGELVSLLKSTSIVGYIAVQDLTKMSDIIRSRTYEAFFPLISTAIIYFILAWVISLILRLILNATSKRPV